ncbi:MAG: hypothetical protein ACTSQH_07555 [Candidatus Hodarchaeales archaeon]
MTDVGTATWGVIISTGHVSNIPSGDKCYFLCDDVQPKHMDKNNNKHVAGRTHYSINTKISWYECTLNSCRVATNTLVTLNSYNALLLSWKDLKTEVYLWLKDSASTYYDWLVGGSMQDYLPCTIKSPKTDSLKHNEKTINIKVEEI